MQTDSAATSLLFTIRKSIPVFNETIKEIGLPSLILILKIKYDAGNSQSNQQSLS
jgi:hypothetical protein